jgi:sigma-E factor negative regulatory protein RseA
MNTKDMAREQISAFADGELANDSVDAAMAALRQPDAREDWALYHQIGDVLRSDDMAFAISPGFSSRMAAALEQEPAIVAPAAQAEAGAGRSRRWVGPGMAAAAAAVAAVAFIATPQLMVALKGNDGAEASAMPSLASANRDATASAGGALLVKANAAEGVVLRDPRIDDYLLAHQRFSPSLYSTAQYARSATFANDSNK